MRKTILILLIIFAVFTYSAIAQESPVQFLQGLGNTEYHKIDYQPLEQSYHIFMRLPENYDLDKKYPTVYLLDGGITFPLLGAYYRYLHLAEELPEMIIVGISYGTDDWQKGNQRSRDFTAPSAERSYWGGADEFQIFLKEILFPFIENTYKADPQRRIIFGQSIGGQFVLFTAKTQPYLFWGHIASNPALHRNLDFFLGDIFPEIKAAEKSLLYVSSAENDDERFRTPAVKWMDYWQSKEYLPWKLNTETLSGHNHFSAAPAAFRNGLKWIFRSNRL